jgi:hypothetical protein
MSTPSADIPDDKSVTCDAGLLIDEDAARHLHPERRLGKSVAEIRRARSISPALRP